VDGPLDIEAEKCEGTEKVEVMVAVLEKEDNQVVDYRLGKDIVMG
jgi:hypothetical protein